MEGTEEKSAAGHASAESSLDLATCKLTALPDLRVKTEEDKKDCYIYGVAALSSGRLLVADWLNFSVKLVDTNTNTVTSTLKLASRPHAVTSLPGDQAAVTIYKEQKIQVISTRSALSPVRTISTYGICYGISSTRDRLVVTYIDPAKVQILDHQGCVLLTIQHDSQGQPLFKRPFNAEVRREGSQHMIYVSDRSASQVVKMTETGEILFTYTHPDMEWPPASTVTDQGQLLVLSCSTHQLHLVSPSGKWIKTLLERADGLYCPQSVSFCQEENKLYVSNAGRNNIKMYQISQ